MGGVVGCISVLGGRMFTVMGRVASTYINKVPYKASLATRISMIEFFHVHVEKSKECSERRRKERE